ncbi:toluene tolerance protein [Litorilituus lipolyticus]|uniref:Toluene tolerance protein n=2 Tax=Litorilituus lipolyticus TaxID=2491017 RepID=A0A502L6W8_9GAMM|nr:toluene tolerance protein [Litorilituus lipolyticus]
MSKKRKVMSFFSTSMATNKLAQWISRLTVSLVIATSVNVSWANELLADQSNPYHMIKEVAGITFKRFADEQQAIQANPNLLKNIVREELMPYVNYKYSAFKVIGKHLKKTTDAERRAFVPVFKEYLVTSYAQVFTLYDNQEVEFAPARDFSGKKIVAVNTIVVMPGRDNIDVSFKVRKNKKTQKWAAYDMVAEGVSLLDSKQAELGSIIRQKGLPYVTQMLKKKSERDIVFKNSNKSTAAKSSVDALKKG